MKNNDLEKLFDSLCGGIPVQEPRDLWPRISRAIAGRRRQKRYIKTLWAAGFSAAAVLIVLSIPGASESIKNGLKRMFSSDYSVQIGDEKPVNGILISANGEVKRIRAGNILLEVLMTKIENNSVKIDVSMFKLVSASPEIPVEERGVTFGIGEGGGEPGAYKFNIERVGSAYAYRGRFDPVESMPSKNESVRGDLIPDGRATIIRDGRWLLAAHITEIDGTAKAGVLFFKRYGRPKIVTRMGTEASIAVSEGSGPVYKFTVTPSEKDLDTYTGSLEPEKTPSPAK